MLYWILNIISSAWHKFGNILGIVFVGFFFLMPKVQVLLVYKEQAKQFYKIPGIKFKLFCLHSFMKSVSILWLALIVTTVYQHFSNANISVKQICLGGGRGNVHFIPKKEDYSWVKLFNLILKKAPFSIIIPHILQVSHLNQEVFKIFPKES